MGFGSDRATLRQLEALLVSDPDDVAAIDRYGALLRTQRDARGELIALEATWETAPRHWRPKLIAQRRSLFRDCGPTLAPAAIIEMAARARPSTGLDVSLGERSWVRWRRGFIRAAHLDVADCPGGQLQAAVDELLMHPAAMLLGDLRLAPAPLWGVSFPDLIAALATHPPPLVRLEYGALGALPGARSFALGDLRRLWPALPRLRELVLEGDAPVLGTIDLPELRSLAIAGDHLGDPAIRDLARSPLRSLRRLVLELGPAHGISERALAALIDALAAAPMIELAIGGAGDLATAVLRRLVGSPMLAGLRSLSLRRGHFADADLVDLAGHAAGFAHLETLDLSGSGLSPAGALAPLAAQVGRLVL